jgi:hypothetical protein
MENPITTVPTSVQPSSGQTAPAPTPTPSTAPTPSPAAATPAPPSDVFADAYTASQAGHPISTDAKGSDPFANAFSDSVAGRPPSTGTAPAAASGTTAWTTPLSPEVQSEGSGVMDILHGNFRQGASKIYEAERPHVIQGSLLEEAMQKIDPSFQGSMTKDDVVAHNGH